MTLASPTGELRRKLQSFVDLFESDQADFSTAFALHFVDDNNVKELTTQPTIDHYVQMVALLCSYELQDLLPPAQSSFDFLKDLLAAYIDQLSSMRVHMSLRSVVLFRYYWKLWFTYFRDHVTVPFSFKQLLFLVKFAWFRVANVDSTFSPFLLGLQGASDDHLFKLTYPSSPTLGNTLFQIDFMSQRYLHKRSLSRQHASAELRTFKPDANFLSALHCSAFVSQS